MITLCMDTSHIFLVLALIQDDALIASIQESCWKRQSEEIFPKLEELFKEAGLQPEDIDQVVITEGPGSYTGVRIAMTIAKVYCAMQNKPLYTIGTLDLYAGNQTCRVILDARGKRVYTGTFENGERTSGPEIKSLEELKDTTHILIGDGHLAGHEDIYPDLAKNFLLTRDHWVKADNVHMVKPEYLKSKESYLVKK